MKINVCTAASCPCSLAEVACAAGKGSASPGPAGFPIDPRDQRHTAHGLVLRKGCDTPDRGGRELIGPAKTYDERESDEAMAGQKIRIRLKSYDHEVIDSSARKIVDTVTRAGATVVGPVPLPTEKNVFVVIR